jgi:hypothetical protein
MDCEGDTEVVVFRVLDDGDPLGICEPCCKRALLTFGVIPPNMEFEDDGKEEEKKSGQGKSAGQDTNSGAS